jgi:ABC-type molybdenum transport system ATPase subunit/photorepair protein PhrA
VGKPDLLLLEDPFTGMSAADTERLACVCREGAGTIVVATHTCDEAIGQFADLVVNWDGQRISMMHDAVGAV